MTPATDPFRVLGLTAGASLNEIRSAYRRLAKQYHPDTAGERALPRFLAIQAAYERLVDAEGRLRPDPLKPRAPRAGWSADADRARATRDAYRARRAGWTSPASGGAASAGAGGGKATGGGTTSGPRRRTADGAGPRPGTEWATSGGRTRKPGSPPPGAEPGSRRRKPRTATPGSTTYDEAAETPLDPAWQGAGWYGPASGTYWTINPREYADPRKHGPEYQARARRAAEVEADQERRRRRGEPVEDALPDADAATDPAPETDAAGASAGWAWTRDASRGTTSGAGAPGTTTDAGAGDWTAEAWHYDEAEQAFGPTAAAREAARHGTPRATTAGDEPLADLEALLARLGPRSLRALAARGDVRSRVILALLAWPPIGFAAASLLDAVTGCAVFSPGCTQTASMLSVAAQPLIVAALVLLPMLAAAAAFATVATLLVTLPMAAALSALLGPDVGMGRGVLVATAIGTYLAAFVAALLRGGGSATTAPPVDEATT